jgi:hypothetical protein
MVAVPIANIMEQLMLTAIALVTQLAGIFF